jgi:O-antigen ligase
MSLTALAWVLIACAQLLGSIRRPVWALGFYLQTFFAAPSLWWWGRELPNVRYALWAGIFYLLAAVFHLAQSPDASARRRTIVHTAAVLMIINATVVNFLLSSHPDISIDTYTELLKYVLLFFIMWVTIQDRRDFRTALIIIAVGASYIGWEVTVNERGSFDGSRLEGVGAPGAENANSLANVMLLCLPLVGSLFLNKSKVAKLTALGAAPLVLNVLLLCNSRGAFLGLLGAALSFLLVARGQSRKRAVQTLALGGIMLFMLLGDPKILERFSTTFVGSEQRDQSAASRLDFWRAGLLMLQDYPLGDGGGAFKYVHGARYTSQVTGTEAEDRSLHNGYLTEATDWGIQGLILKLLFVGGAFVAAFRTVERARREQRIEDSLIGVCVVVSGAGFLIDTLFASTLSSEWAYWVVALLVKYSELYARPEAAAEAGEPLPKAA